MSDANSCELVIETFALTEAELLDRIVEVTFDRDTFRLMLSVTLGQLAETSWRLQRANRALRELMGVAVDNQEAAA